MAPTNTTIVEEAFKRLNIPDPGSVELTRAKDPILTGVLKNIAKKRPWVLLEQTAVRIPTAFLPRYAVPMDYSKAANISLFSGGATGTMQSATASTITLAADETLTQAEAEGTPIFILTDNAVGQMSRIIAYNTGTKEATISPDWGTTPISGDYLVPDTETDLPFLLNRRPRLIETAGTPDKAFIYNRELYLSPPPNVSTVAVVMRYQLNVWDIVAGDRLNEIYEDWYNALLYGVMVSLADTPGDEERAKKADVEYREAIQTLAGEDDARKRLGG